MQFKIDENLHSDAADLLRQCGHDAFTVFEQGLRGEADTEIANVCRQEARAIITLDLDFSDIRTYPPDEYFGMVVLRLGCQEKSHVLKVLEQLVPKFNDEPLASKLWIVSETTVRIWG